MYFFLEYFENFNISPYNVHILYTFLELFYFSDIRIVPTFTLSSETSDGRLRILYEVIADNYVKRSRRLPQFTFAYIYPTAINYYADIKKFTYRAAVRRVENKF